MRSPTYCTHMHFFFFFNDTATTEIYTLSLHDALPICTWMHDTAAGWTMTTLAPSPLMVSMMQTATSFPFFVLALDRKSTRLNSSHANISYAVFCLKKKNKTATIGYRNDLHTAATSQVV